MRHFRACPGACRDPTFALVAMRKLKVSAFGAVLGSEGEGVTSADADSAPCGGDPVISSNRLHALDACESTWALGQLETT